jgi:molybdate transport system substrate-binding protein
MAVWKANIPSLSKSLPCQILFIVDEDWTRKRPHAIDATPQSQLLFPRCGVKSRRSRRAAPACGNAAKEARVAEIAPGGASIGPITILCTRALRGALTELAPALARAGLSCAPSYGASNELLARIAAGERTDMAILTREAIDGLVATGVIAGAVDLARALVGIAVRAGAPKPEIGTPEALRRALLAARSVGYSRSGASGLHFARVIERLGIADEVNRKARIADGFVAEWAASGEVEIAVQQVSELMAVPGVEMVGALPEALQETTAFAAGIFTGAANRAGGEALICHLASAACAPALRRSGLSPL